MNSLLIIKTILPALYGLSVAMRFRFAAYEDLAYCREYYLEDWRRV